MPRSEQRHAALTFCLSAVAGVSCFFAWVALLSFSAADAPGDSVWPPPRVPHNACGPVGAWIAHRFFYYLGYGAFPLMFLLSAAVVAKLRNVRLNDLWLRLLGLAIIVTVVSTAAGMFLFPNERHLIHGPGGALGAAIADFCAAQFRAAGSLILLACAFVVGMILAADEWVIALTRLFGWAGRGGVRVLVGSGNVISGPAAGLLRGPRRGKLPPAGMSTDCSSDELVDSRSGEIIERRPGRKKRERFPEPRDGDPSADVVEPLTIEPVPAEASSAGPVVTELRPTRKNKARLETERLPFPGGISAPDSDNYELPPLDLLEEAKPMDKKAIEFRCREKALILEQTLNEFRLEVKVVAIETGPVITVFELKLAPGIKVSQINSLSNDMARALKAPAVRVVAPLPGRNTVGIEVPNLDKEKVRLRDLMDMTATQRRSYAVPMYLGKDASGQPIVADLTRMPHLLIAGTTGSGKSVCITSIIMSILATRTPSEVKLILIDPKVVELANFKDIPHLMCPIVTEVSKAEAILDWAATKMDERYALFAEVGVKDIHGYNRLGIDGLKERIKPASDEEMERIPAFLPYFVIIIDELADLMMTSAKEVEFYLCRLAQKSRAVGIHLIVSTQRPQANVVTGLIKSNMPSRIAFRVASRLDSRIVLDQNGGEVLLGQGDMLFLPPGTSKLTRAQGTFIADEELRAYVRHCNSQTGPQFHPELIRLPSGSISEVSGARDEFFDQAVDIIIESGRGSVSLLQRRLTIGYGRASRLVDQMYEAGIVGEYKGSQAREVVMSEEDWNSIRSMRDREERQELTAAESDLPT